MKINGKDSEIDYTVKSYMDSIKQYKSLKKSEEKKLMLQYKTYGNIDARNKLITSNLKFACKLASWYMGKGMPFSYLISEANSALLYAIDKFDTNKDVKLISYAQWWMNQRVQALLTNNSQSKEDLIIDDEEKTFKEKNDNYDDVYEENDRLICLPFNNTSNEQNKTKIVNTIFSNLNETEVDMIKMRFGIEPYEKENTLEEIGIKYNLTKERIRQLIDKTMLKMRSIVMSNQL